MNRIKEIKIGCRDKEVWELVSRGYMLYRVVSVYRNNKDNNQVRILKGITKEKK